MAAVGTIARTPLAITGPLSARLGEVHDYWRRLLRGEATIPFTDDVDPNLFGGICPDIFLVGVFERPRRFRLDFARMPEAPQVERQYLGRFLDEFDAPTPLEFILAQAAAAAEGPSPTIYQHRPRRRGRAYDRLLLPAWGEGRVSLLIGAVEFH